MVLIRRVWGYHNQNPYIEEEQTTQCPKGKNYKRTNNDLQNTHETKDRVTRTPLKHRGGVRCSGRVCSSFSTSNTRHVNLVTNPVMSHEWGKDQEVFTSSGTYPWSFVTQILYSDIKPYIDFRMNGNKTIVQFLIISMLMKANEIKQIVTWVFHFRQKICRNNLFVILKAICITYFKREIKYLRIRLIV